MKQYSLPDIHFVPLTIILANGDFPSHPIALAWLDTCPFVVCCDGAADAYVASGRIPAAIVGDGDSLSFEIKDRYSDIVFSETEQDTNDLNKAFRFCLSQGRRDIVILGATGKREDHTLGNISLLVDFMEQAQVVMLTDYGVFTPIHEDTCFRSYPGEHVSVFNMGCTSLSAEGLVYPLSVFTNWWQGTLNVVEGDSFVIHTDGKVLVFREF